MVGALHLAITPAIKDERSAHAQLSGRETHLDSRSPIDELSCADLEEVKKKCVKNMAAVTSETAGMKNITLVFPYGS